MKKILCLMIAFTLLFTSCTGSYDYFEEVFNETEGSSYENTDKYIYTPTRDISDFEYLGYEMPEYSGLGDSDLLSYIEYAVYAETLNNLENSDYFIQEVKAVYISQEYIDQLAYNSKSNVYFGYTLSELDNLFTSSKYVFTVNDSGQTIVESYTACNDVFEQVMKDVAIGTGVILVCVTVSVATGGVAPAISVIMAASAKTAVGMAISGAALGAVSAGVITGIETKDSEAAFEAAAIGFGDGFKIGAISGAFIGGVSSAAGLYGATANGLTMNEVATIQRESKYPLDVIKGFSSMEQYQICKTAGLKPVVVNGRTALVRAIDLDFVDDFGRTNLQRMSQGLAPIDPATGGTYELHHIGQKMDSTLAVLTKAEHMQGGNNKIWHLFGETSNIDRGQFAIERQQFWQSLASSIASGG